MIPNIFTSHFDGPRHLPQVVSRRRVRPSTTCETARIVVETDLKNALQHSEHWLDQKQILHVAEVQTVAN